MRADLEILKSLMNILVISQLDKQWNWPVGNYKIMIQVAVLHKILWHIFENIRFGQSYFGAIYLLPDTSHIYIRGEHMVKNRINRITFGAQNS